MGIAAITTIVLMLIVLVIALNLATSSSYLSAIIRELLALTFRAFIGFLKGK